MTVPQCWITEANDIMSQASSFLLIAVTPHGIRTTHPVSSQHDIEMIDEWVKAMHEQTERLNAYEALERATRGLAVTQPPKL